MKKNTACRYCGSERLVRFLALGEHPPSNSFIRCDEIPFEKRYPLEVYFCEGCYLVQLVDVVPPEIVFNEYVYLSSSSRALTLHYERLAGFVTSRFGLRAGDLVVDIGCNDGILLHGYSLQGLVKVGVEPSKVADVAAAAGLEVVRGFFGPEVAQTIVDRRGTAKVVTAANVFAHVDDIGRFVEGLLLLLGDHGVFIIEAPYVIDLIDQVLFDTIYHEHLCYLCLTPVVRFLERYGLEVFDVERVPFGASGPAFRVFIQKYVHRRGVGPSVATMLGDEFTWGVGRIQQYARCAGRVNSVREGVLKILKEVRACGARIGGYGAPAKGNTLLNYLSITPELVECIAETNPLKRGLLTPGSHIPIVSEEEFIKRMPEYALLLSWNYLDFFLENSEYIRRGGKFIVPIPDPRIVP